MCSDFPGMENKVTSLKKSYKQNKIKKLIKIFQSMKKKIFVLIFLGGFP